MKDTLIEIKNNLQGNSSRVDEPRFKSMIWNIKSNQSEQQEKRIQQNKDNVSSLWNNFKQSNVYNRGARRRERARNWKSI